MANEQENESLAVSDGNAAALPASISDDPVLSPGEHLDDGLHSSVFSDTRLMRKIMLAGIITLGILLIFLLFIWVQQPKMRPLGHYQTEELIPILDYLDQELKQHLK